MYVSMKEMLKKANQENYAVMAINCFNLETAKAVINAAEEMKAPIIVNLLQEHLIRHLNYRYLTQPIIRMAKNSPVPVAINLDHGQDVSFVKQCLKEGFSSIMIDASMYSLEKNIAITKKMVDFSETYNASVEAEVGSLGTVSEDSLTEESMFTNPKDAIRFIYETNVDCLAISYGSSHGNYSTDYVPEFRFDIVKKIKEATNIPLVLHGGSGAGEENLKKSIELGINKINVGADFMKAQAEFLKQEVATKKEIDYPTVIHGTIEAGKKVVKGYILLSGSKGKAF